MIACIVRSNALQRVPRESVAAVVINSLESAAGEENHALTRRQTSGFEGNAGSEGIEEEAFKGVIVESAKSVGNVETVVPGVKGCFKIQSCASIGEEQNGELTVEPSIHMHKAVEKVLPGVDNNDCEAELQCGNQIPVKRLSDKHLPGREL